MSVRFDLIDMAKALKARGRFILIVTTLATACGALFYFIGPKKYKASSEFFVCNPLYSDRNNIFRTSQSQFIDYFGTEDDIDKVIAIANSELARVNIVGKQDLAKVYGLDTGSTKDAIRLADIFRNNYEIKRTSNQNMEISYVHTDPQIAANVANQSVMVIEEIYRGYFNKIRMNIYHSVEQKKIEIDSMILSMTDTLARLRDKSGIYDLLSPNRQIMVSSGYKANGKENLGRAIEEIQNVESVKDQMVESRAYYLALMNEFSTGTKLDQMPLVQVISAASPPNKPKGLGATLTIVAAMFTGFFFSSIWVLLKSYFNLLVSVER